MKTVDYKKKIELCQKLGADKFQKVVFKVEEIKYKVIKKVFPRYLEWYDKISDKKRDKELKKAKTEADRKKIINHYRQQKMLMRKEFYREKNRNYHMDPNKPTEIIHYLEWNKDIHVRGIKRNVIALPALGIATALGVTSAFTIPMIAFELGNLFINFQCVNIQNCNIYRFKLNEEAMKKLEERRAKRHVEEYGEAGAVVSRSMQKTDDIPTFTQIIDNIQSKEELEQLRKLVQVTLGTNKKEAEKSANKENSSGGKK